MDRGVASVRKRDELTEADMAGPQWENLPEPRPERPAPSLRTGWQGFTVDPRPPANQGLRAADADRDYATRLVEQARLDGRLTVVEAEERGARASGSRTLGELLPLVGDLMAVTTNTGYARHERGRRFTRGGAMGWVGLALLFNAIWIMASLTAGRPAYYWPMWPLFFIGLPLVMSLFANRGQSQPPRPEQSRQLPPGDELR
jgi:hypothetical protein